MDDHVQQMESNSISMALSDFYAKYDLYGTRPALSYRNSKGNASGAATAAAKLLQNIKVKAIVRTLLSSQALGDEVKVPNITFDSASSRPSVSSSTQCSNFIHVTLNDTYQVKVTSSVYGWREVVVIYMDNEFGKGTIPCPAEKARLTNGRFQNMNLSVNSTGLKAFEVPANGSSIGLLQDIIAKLPSGIQYEYIPFSNVEYKSAEMYNDLVYHIKLKVKKTWNANKTKPSNSLALERSWMILLIIGMKMAIAFILYLIRFLYKNWDVITHSISDTIAGLLQRIQRGDSNVPDPRNNDDLEVNTEPPENDGQRTENVTEEVSQTRNQEIELANPDQNL